MNTVNTNEEVNVISEQKLPHNKQRLIWAGAIVLVLIIIGMISALFLRTKQAPKESENQVPIGTQEPKTATPTPQATVTDVGVSWLKEPQLLTQDIGAILLEPDLVNEKVKYYLLGKDNNQDIILAVAPPVSPSGDRHLMFVKAVDGFEFIVRNSDNFFTASDNNEKTLKTYDSNEGPLLASNVIINNQKYYQSITPPDVLRVSGVDLKKQYSLYYWFSDYVASPENTLTKYSETPYGALYLLVRKDARQADIAITTTNVEAYVLKMINGSVAMYQHIPSFVSDSLVPKITWSDGVVNKEAFRWDKLFGGCGTPGYANVVDPKFANGLVIVGKTSSGENIYSFTSPTDQTVQEQYKSNMPEGTYYQYDEKKNSPTYIKISIGEYLQNHGVFVYKDPLGRNILFTNFKYGPQAECGKPVIYLYPPKATKVSVKVDVNISKSEPQYGFDGWSVTAFPDGKIINSDGNSYDSLFWEGMGKYYPEISEGFVVKQADLEATLWLHLTKLGLNKKEASDFMAFWLPKMPTTPYVRLTWFGTRQMDRLAPLFVSPVPDTVIRLFLDFEGLNNPVKLKPQVLNAIQRDGFSVVEWGGLLKKN